MKGRGYTVFSMTFLFFLSVLVMLRQLTSTGYFSCIINDTYNYTSWAWQFAEAVKEGVVYPRWLPLNFWGYGSPTFVFYPPLAFYLVALMNVATNSVVAAMNVVKFTSLFLSAAGMFFLVREVYSEKIALLTAAFSAVFAYNIFGLYLTGNFASSVSLMWFAPILLFTYRYVMNRRHKDLLFAGMCYGGLILTHVVNAYMFSFVLVAFVIYLSIVRKRPGDLVVIPLTVITGCLVAAAYLLPLISEMRFINISGFIREGVGYHFEDFFLFPGPMDQLRTAKFWPFFYNALIFYLFLFCVLFGLFLLQITKMRRMKIMENANVLNRFFLAAGIGSLFFLFSISRVVWEVVPFFQYIQFPGRWLLITTFCASFLASSVFCVLGAVYRAERGRPYFFGLLIAGGLLLGYNLSLDYEYIRLAPVFTERMLMPVKGDNMNLGHLPGSADIARLDRNDAGRRLSILSGAGTAAITTWKSAERSVEITALTPCTVRIRTFNFPGWKAYSDGVEMQVKTEDGSGAILLDIPQGKHTLTLRFEDTPVRYYGKIISLVSLIIAVVIAFVL